MLSYKLFEFSYLSVRESTGAELSVETGAFDASEADPYRGWQPSESLFPASRAWFLLRFGYIPR